MFLFDINGKQIGDDKGNGFWYPSDKRIIDAINESTSYNGLILVFITRTEGQNIIIDTYKYMKE